MLTKIIAVRFKVIFEDFNYIFLSLFQIYHKIIIKINK